MTVTKAASGTLNIVDLLCTRASHLPFTGRVRRLQLPEDLEQKILRCHNHSQHVLQLPKLSFSLNQKDEETLAAQVLYYRHKFTCCLLQVRQFRQAALTVIQNTYLFQHRHIFFQPETNSQEMERQQALELFSSSSNTALPVALSLRHPVLARIWARINQQAGDDLHGDPFFLQLHGIVENLNTLRNVYMLFSSRLLLKLAGSISPVYKQSISYEDGVQIGSFGIARAAYRYHPSCGVRFSTYASNWFFKEIQRQALSGRLIHISANSVERYAAAAQGGDNKPKYLGIPDLADALPESGENHRLETTIFLQTAVGENPAHKAEADEQQNLLIEAIETGLAKRTADIIKRRYGLAPYRTSQSIMTIAGVYGTTRGRIYQIEQEAFHVLQRMLRAKNRIYTAA